MAEKILVRVEGHNGQVEFDGQTLTVHREGFAGKMAGGIKRIVSLDKIARVDFEDASAMSPGFIRFAIPGQATSKPQRDETCVTFKRKQSQEFSKLRDQIDAALADRGELPAEVMEDMERVRRESDTEHLAAAKAQAAAFVSYKGHSVDLGTYIYKPEGSGNSVRKPLAGASSVFDSGSDRSRPTLTRIGAGAILAGPAGAIVGGLFKKDTSKSYVTVIFADGDSVIIEGPSKDEKKLREFAADVNRLAAN